MSSSGTVKQKARLNKVIVEKDYNNLFLRLKAEHVKLQVTKRFIKLANETSAAEAITEAQFILNELQKLPLTKEVGFNIGALKKIMSWYLASLNLDVALRTANKKVIQYQKVINYILDQKY